MNVGSLAIIKICNVKIVLIVQKMVNNIRIVDSIYSAHLGDGFQTPTTSLLVFFPGKDLRTLLGNSENFDYPEVTKGVNSQTPLPTHSHHHPLFTLFSLTKLAFCM